MKYCGDNKVVNINDSSEILKLCHRNQFHIFDEYFVNTNFNHKLNVFSCAQIFVNYFCSENSYSDLDKSLININNSLMVSKSNIIYLNIILSKKFHSAFQINIMTLSVLYSSEIHHVYFLCPIRGFWTMRKIPLNLNVLSPPCDFIIQPANLSPHGLQSKSAGRKYVPTSQGVTSAQVSISPGLVVSKSRHLTPKYHTETWIYQHICVFKKNVIAIILFFMLMLNSILININCNNHSLTRK